MVSQQLTVKNPTGLHCRPLGQVVQAAKGCDCRLTICKGERRFDAKVMIQLLQAGICQGDEITVEADGPGEQEALGGLVDVIEGLTE